MTEKEIKDFYKEMFEHFKVLPNPEKEPKRFAYYVKLFRYYKTRKLNVTK
jgi:hypothetical protein